MKPTKSAIGFTAKSRNNGPKNQVKTMLTPTPNNKSGNICKPYRITIGKAINPRVIAAPMRSTGNRSKPLIPVASNNDTPMTAEKSSGTAVKIKIE